MSINQLGDDGAVIGYKPILQYNKESKSNVSAEDKSPSATNYSGNFEYSKTINSLSSNLPSTALGNIDFALQNMKRLVDKLALSFKKGNWNQYGEISSLLSAVESNDEEYITNFINYHKDKITGSIIPELIGTIHSTEQRLKILSDIIKELYYGEKTLTTEEAKEIDKSYLEKIKSYEANGEKSKINYLALSYDSSLNRSISMYSFSANEQVIDIADTLIASDDSSTDSSKASLIQKMFDEVNEEIDYRKYSYNEQQSIEIMKKTLYNYYSKRQELIELYDLFNQNNESIFIGRKIQSYREQIDDAIININKSFVGNQYFLSEIVKLEREKHFLKNIYASFNYNPDI